MFNCVCTLGDNGLFFIHSVYLFRNVIFMTRGHRIFVFVGNWKGKLIQLLFKLDKLYSKRHTLDSCYKEHVGTWSNCSIYPMFLIPMGT